MSRALSRFKTEKLKKLISFGRKIAIRFFEWLGLFLSPRRFWTVYGFIFFLFAHGFLYSMNIDTVFVSCDVKHCGLLRGVSYITGMAICLWVLTIFRAGIFYVSGLKKQSFIAILYAMLMVCYAKEIAFAGLIGLYIAADN